MRVSGERTRMIEIAGRMTILLEVMAEQGGMVRTCKREISEYGAERIGQFGG